MRPISLFLILIVSALGTACDNEIIDNGADFKFETIDKESNKINLEVTIRYRLKSRTEKQALRKYGRHYKDSLLLPVISSISESILKDYSAGEIYNYKREEIEQKLNVQTKTTFAESDLELTSFFINSVKLSDTLMQRLEKEHIARFQEAMNNCKREIKGAISQITDMGSYEDLVMYEFFIENKRYFGYLNKEEAKRSEKVTLGDSLVIEYACEDPIFHKVKR
jgi:hypothetical protein